MEVCGRYHHWMPILIRVVHRDTFLSWCLIYLRAINGRSLGGESGRAGITNAAWADAAPSKLLWAGSGGLLPEQRAGVLRAVLNY